MTQQELSNSVAAFKAAYSMINTLSGHDLVATVQWARGLYEELALVQSEGAMRRLDQWMTQNDTVHMLWQEELSLRPTDAPPVLTNGLSDYDCGLSSDLIQMY